MFKALWKPSPKKLIENEIDESNRLLLQAHTNTEHWQSQVDYHTKKLNRLTKAWNKLQAEDKEKDKDNG